MIDAHAAEAVEREALLTWFGAATANGNADWSVHEVGDALCFVAPSEPSILVNRVLGLGANARPGAAQLATIREIYSNAGITRFFLHVMPESLGPDRETLLSAAGYRKYRGWMKFARAGGEIRAITTDLDIRAVDRAYAADFALIAGDAFDFDPGFRPALASLVGAPGWQVYMSFDGDTPAGTGALFMNDGLAYLDFGATHPDFRRRGAQSAVLSMRIRAALDAGCRAIVTMTGEAVPGDAQHSYRNIEKAGFSATYLRENWIPSDG